MSSFSPLLVYQIGFWVNCLSIAVFISVEIFWFIKQKNTRRTIPSLVAGFFIYNLPFLLLALSMCIQAVPVSWVGMLRLVFLMFAIPVNGWLHYHLDKGGNSIGMAVVFFLIVAVPLLLILELFVAFY